MNLADKTEVSGLTFDNKPVIALNDLQLAERREYLSRLGTGQYVERTVEACHYVLVTRRFGWSFAKDRYALPVKTAVCQNCGLVFTANPLDQCSVVRFYTEQYRRLYGGEELSGPEWAGRSSKWFDERLDLPDALALKMPELAPPDLSHLTVIELGCGGGWNLYGFYKRRAEVVGFDYDNQIIGDGRNRGMRMKEGSVDEAIASGMKADLVILVARDGTRSQPG